MMHPERILRDDYVDTMVAADTFDLLYQRIEPMVTAGRQMALAVREFTYLHRPPVVYAGLTLKPGTGIWVQNQTSRVHCGIVLLTGRPGLDDQISFGFGAGIYRDSGNETERESRGRYDTHQAEADSHFDRRRNMTHVVISGGLPGSRYLISDQVVVSEWNEDGVCTEKVLAFEPEGGSW